MRNKTVRKVCSLFLAWTLILSSFPMVGIASMDPEDYYYHTGTGFEDDSTWGFIPGAGAEAVIVEEDSGNHYLATSGAGSGGRSITKTFDEPTKQDEIWITFDWKPGEVSTGANSSEIVIRDSYDYPIFRVAKAGGTDGQLYYGAGSTGIDLSSMQTVTGVTYTDEWLSVSIVLDFNDELIDLEIHERDDPSRAFVQHDIDLSQVLYLNQVQSIAVNGNRASGQSLSFTAGIDNFHIYGSSNTAPPQPPKQITSIETSYPTHLLMPLRASLEDVVGFFPSKLDVRLDNGMVIELDVEWHSDDYDADTLGVYQFIGEFKTDGIPNLANSLDIVASAQIELTESVEPPTIPGYTPAIYSDFGDTLAVVPVNWGFTTANATLDTHTDDLAGNSTPKLAFSQINQTGGRVATKNLESAIIGSQVLAKFDWYPGELNDKGGNANENGGELRILDDSNNVIFTLNNTKNEPLRVFAGTRIETAQETSFTNMNTWYNVELLLDIETNEAIVTIEDVSTSIRENFQVSLDDVTFDGFVGSIRLVGLRTSGNNITWTTYLDNFGIYYVPVLDHTIISVDRLPYHRIYVGDATSDIASIGLPEHITVTLADGSKATVTMEEWTAVGAWEPTVDGVYEFTGTIAESESVVNLFDRKATIYVYNRLPIPDKARQTEWLDRGVIALTSEEGMFISWRLRADEYSEDVKFHLYRNDVRLNQAPLNVTNYTDPDGVPGDVYKVVTLVNGRESNAAEVTALSKDYLAIPMQVPEGGVTSTSAYTYSVNDGGVGDLDGDGEYEVIVKWYPSNAIDSSQQGVTGPTIFDAYKLDGTLLWRINMGNNLTSGAHYHQFIIADLDGDGKSEFAIKTADATTVYGTTDGIYDPSKVIDVIGNPEDDGKWVNDDGHVFDGPEYFTIFNGETGEVIDTVDYAYPLGDVNSWGDSWHNRSDRFLAGLAYLDGVKPSVIYGRGYYERTTFVAYSLVDGEIVEEWTFDSSVEGRGGGLGFHSLATGDVDNDGYDEIIAGSLTLDQDGSILYMMDGEMGRERGSHGDAMHVGAFDPDREGLHFIGVHEVPEVASLEYHDGATGETLMSFYASKDAGRGLAANITSAPGYEFWGAAGFEPETGGGIYNVQGHVVADDHRAALLSVNFALYWDGDLLHELLDHTSITKYNETTGVAELVRNFDGTVSNNGTKATPTLQADIIGDWREEVLLPSEDSSELRIYSTTIPTEYRLYTLMHDTVYRMAIAWQNVAYNQPPHIGFYLGEDIRDTVLAGELDAPKVVYTNGYVMPRPGGEGSDDGGSSGGGYGPIVSPPTSGAVSDGEDGEAVISPSVNRSGDTLHVQISSELFDQALKKAAADQNNRKTIVIDVDQNANQLQVELPHQAIRSSGQHVIVIKSALGTAVLPSSMLSNMDIDDEDKIELVIAGGESSSAADRKVITIHLLVNGEMVDWHNPNGSVRITIPYEPTGLEEELHEFISVVHIGEDGVRTPVYNGRFDTDARAVVFETDHFSQYAVVFDPKTFADLTAYDWAQHEIEVLATKGIINGTTVDTFSPAASITRADYLLLLVKTLGLNAQVDSQFSDVHTNDYYYEAVAIAKALGITNGDGQRKFNPRDSITRQDMFTLTARALAVSGNGLEDASEDVLAGFSDREDIASYAVETIAALVADELVIGNNGRVNPLGLTTRAEAAVFLYRIYSR